MDTNYLRTLAVVLVIIPLSSGFLEEYPCFDPCVCPPAFYMNPTVNCSYKKLTEWPSFEADKDPFADYPRGGLGEKNLHLDHNLFTYIPRAAFSALGVMYPDDTLVIDASYNQISKIDKFAFEGLDNVKLQLNLRGNKLTALGDEFCSASTLEELDLTFNPITFIDAKVVQTLAPILKFFFISVDKMNEFPEALNELQAETISIDGLRETTLSGKVQDDRFIGVLDELFISNSSLIEVSSVPCRFPNLQHLRLENNYNLREDMFAGCNDVNNLTLNVLDIVNCNMATMDISIYSTVMYLKLRENAIVNVPESLRSLKEVWMVDLSFNSITTITADDFQGLTNLEMLFLDGNPLTSIADRAFQSNSIETISLLQTKLTTIPMAVVNIQSLYSLSLPDLTITCSCEHLRPLTSWTMMPVSNTRCKNDPDVSVYNYVTDVLPQCN